MALLVNYLNQPISGLPTDVIHYSYNSLYELNFDGPFNKCKLRLIWFILRIKIILILYNGYMSRFYHSYYKLNFYGSSNGCKLQSIIHYMNQTSMGYPMDGSFTSMIHFINQTSMGLLMNVILTSMIRPLKALLHSRTNHSR